MTERFKEILVVEDNPNDAELMMQAFSENNTAHTVQVARDGQEALDFLLRRRQFAERPDGNPLVIILDLKMPKVNGFEVLKRIKSDVNLKLIPIVVFSSSSEERDLAECYSSGVNAYVVKPVDYREFIYVVRKIGFFWSRINKPSRGGGLEKESR
jgi:CheY-like chemotaxis protein